MRRAAILALMLVAVLVPLTGIVHADMKSDQALQQAPEPFMSGLGACGMDRGLCRTRISVQGDPRAVRSR